MIDQDSVKVVKGDDYIQVAYEIVVGEGDKSLRVRNVNYYFAYKGRWTDVHVSLFPPKDSDEGLLQQFGESLKYQAFDKDVETAAPQAGKADQRGGGPIGAAPIIAGPDNSYRKLFSPGSSTALGENS